MKKTIIIASLLLVVNANLALSNGSDNLTSFDIDKIVIPKSYTSTNTFIFHGKDNKEIGKLHYEKGVFEFEGDAEESAKVFFDYLRRMRCCECN
jgi:hypothetical protein